VSRAPGRRQVLAGLGGALVSRWLAGCDRLVILDDLVGAAIEPITPNDRFYVYQVGSAPDVDPDRHQVRVVGLDGELLAAFDRAALRALPAREREHTLQCVGARPTYQQIGNARWEGLPLGEVLSALGVRPPPGAVDLVATGADDYVASIPATDLEDGPIWLAWGMNGVPLPRAHGAPARLLVPGRYGMKNVKWPAELRFSREPVPSYWSAQGWSEAAPYRPNTFVASPPDGFEVPPGTVVRFVGTAFAGEDVVEGVEVAAGGDPWRAADLDYAPDVPGVWVLWSFPWEVPPGDHTVAARCRTRSGARSHPSPEGTRPLDGYDGSMAIRIRAR
jgi:DMSO/TMAO reductase YedYZ molybdopterin-dependent catalytic subunit